MFVVSVLILIFLFYWCVSASTHNVTNIYQLESTIYPTTCSLLGMTAGRATVPFGFKYFFTT